MSKYLYDGDLAKISFHNQIVLGVSPLAAIPIGMIFGLFFDKWGELVLVPITFFLAGAPYIALFFLWDIDTVLGYGIQIFGGIFSVLTALVSGVTLAKHSPSNGAGKIFAFKSFFSGIYSIGYEYFSTWLIDQDYNQAIFLVIGGLALAMVGMFIGIRFWCKEIAHKPEEEEEARLLTAPPLEESELQ